jgi:hypothetical protein
MPPKKSSGAAAAIAATQTQPRTVIVRDVIREQMEVQLREQEAEAAAFASKQAANAKGSDSNKDKVKAIKPRGKSQAGGRKSKAAKEVEEEEKEKEEEAEAVATAAVHKASHKQQKNDDDDDEEEEAEDDQVIIVKSKAVKPKAVKPRGKSQTGNKKTKDKAVVGQREATVKQEADSYNAQKEAHAHAHAQPKAKVINDLDEEEHVNDEDGNDDGDEDYEEEEAEEAEEYIPVPGPGDSGKIKVRKVRNAFVLFCSEQKHEPWTAGMLMPAQKKRCGEIWRGMSYEMKWPYQQQYEKDREELKTVTRQLKKEGRLLVVQKPVVPIVGAAEDLMEDKLQDFLPYRKRGSTGAAMRPLDFNVEGSGDGEQVEQKPKKSAASPRRNKSASKKAAARGATPKRKGGLVYAPAPVVAPAPFRQFDKKLEAEVLKRMSDKVRKIAGPDGILPKMSQDAWTKMVQESMQQIKAPRVIHGAEEEEDDHAHELAAVDSGAEEDD